MIIARPKWKNLEKWTREPELADERVLRRGAIAKAMEDNYDPQRKKKANKRLEGSLTKTQERNMKKTQSRVHKDAKKRYNETRRAKDMRHARSRRRYQEAKTCLSEMRAV
ncbi:hypothetical protein MMC28_007687 [Mycoblastus sanguinarius]|nr:hypothetical protein [Mycoblastus sanguinarius]